MTHLEAIMSGDFNNKECTYVIGKNKRGQIICAKRLTVAEAKFCSEKNIPDMCFGHQKTFWMNLKNK